MSSYAKRMDNIKGSDIREILKLTQQPDIISFAGGLPAPELFPIEKIKTAAVEVLNKHGRKALQYGPTEGYIPLRNKIVNQVKKFGIDSNYNNILITSGSQQGLDMIAKLYIDPEDVILCESPSYLGALNAFKAYEPKFIEVKTDNNGMLMDDLEVHLKNNEKIKLIYVIPEFQNPTGRTWSVERRKKLVELANKYNVIIVEDNPYGELRFDGQLNPSVKSFDTENKVIYLGTFSKIFCPGYRTAWILASEDIIHKLIFIKQGIDLQTSTIAQYDINEFMEMYDIEEHIKELVSVYRERRNIMLDEMKKTFPKEVIFTYPEGGLFTWVELPERVNTRDLLVKAVEKKVAFVPGGSFFPNGGNECCMRLNYSNMKPDKIKQGVDILSELIKNELK